MGKIADARAIAEAVKNSINDPLWFFREWLGAEPEEQQIPVIEAFAHARRIVIASGHSAGKDFIAPRLGLWFFITHYPAIVIITAPTERQVKDITWGELRAAYHGSRYEIGGELLPDSPYLKSGDPAAYMKGFVGKTPDAFQGYHGKNVLIIVSEAQAIEAPVYRSINSLMTSPNARLLLLGNPTCEPDSEFYAACSSKAEMYAQFRFDSEKSKYCAREWIEEVRAEHGEDSAYWKARVKGIFPDDIADTLIPLAWIEAAYERWRAGDSPLDKPGAVTLGCDVARFGSDMTVVYRGDGPRFSCVHVVQGQDLMQTSGRLAAMIGGGVKAEMVRIDDTGVGGGVTDRLKEQGHSVRGINFGAGATDEIKFLNARAEMFWSLRDRFRLGEIAIDPADKKLLRDLSVLRYKYQSSGKIAMEEKAEAKRRLGYSPDRADALALAALPVSSADQMSSRGFSQWGFFEYAKRENEKRKAAATSAGRIVVSSQPVSEVPGAVEMTQGGQHKRSSWEGVCS